MGSVDDAGNGAARESLGSRLTTAAQSCGMLVRTRDDAAEILVLYDPGAVGTEQPSGETFVCELWVVHGALVRLWVVPAMTKEQAERRESQLKRLLLLIRMMCVEVVEPSWPERLWAHVWSD